MNYNFFALISRMKYIERWALMRNTRQENLCEHSMEVAMIAHALCTIGNVRYGRHLDAKIYRSGVSGDIPGDDGLVWDDPDWGIPDWGNTGWLD